MRKSRDRWLCIQSQSRKGLCMWERSVRKSVGPPARWLCMICDTSTQKEKMRHERRVLKYQLQIEEAKAKTSPQNFFNTHGQGHQTNFNSSHIPPNPPYQTNELMFADDFAFVP